MKYKKENVGCSEEIQNPSTLSVSAKDIVKGLAALLSLVGVASFIFASTGQTVVSHTATPTEVTTPGGGGGGGTAYAWSSMEFEITNTTPWYDLFFINVNAKQVAYFNTSVYYTGTSISSQSVTNFAHVYWQPGGTVLNLITPKEFTSGTNSNGVSYKIFSGSTEMETYAVIPGDTSPSADLYTNVLVDYEVMGNGNIYIKYWVDYNQVLTYEQAAFMTIGNMAKLLSESGGP